MGRPPKPKPAPVVIPPPIEQCDTQAQGLARIAKELDIKTVPVARNGRPLKASSELIKGICQTIRKGLSIDKSCILHGIKSDSLEKWKKANSDILHMFQRAEIEIEEELIGYITTAAPKDWKASNWLLERRFQWEQRTKAELTGKDGAALNLMSVSQQLFASVAGAGDASAKPKKPKPPAIDVTPRTEDLKSLKP